MIFTLYSFNKKSVTFRLVCKKLETQPSTSFCIEIHCGQGRIKFIILRSTWAYEFCWERKHSTMRCASNSHAPYSAFQFLHIFTSPQMNFWELKVCFSIKSVSPSCSHTIEDQNLAPSMQVTAIGAAWQFSLEPGWRLLAFCMRTV